MREFLHYDGTTPVATLVTQFGVTERYTYNVFGKRNVHDASFNAKSISSYPHFTRAFTGQILDIETGLMLYRNRVYHPILGRFIQRDPIGYSARDMNLYRYVGNRAIAKTDTLGLQNWQNFGPHCIGMSPGDIERGVGKAACEQMKPIPVPKPPKKPGEMLEIATHGKCCQDILPLWEAWRGYSELEDKEVPFRNFEDCVNMIILGFSLTGDAYLLYLGLAAGTYGFLPGAGVTIGMTGAVMLEKKLEAERQCRTNQCVGAKPVEWELVKNCKWKLKCPEDAPRLFMDKYAAPVFAPHIKPGWTAGEIDINQVNR